MEKTIEIPEGYEARIEGGKVIIELKESEDEGIRKFIIDCIDELRKANAENAEFNGKCSESIAYLERQKENPKNADSIPADCVSSAKCENEHNKPGDFVFELRQIISRHRYADMYGECVDDEEGMAREILSLCEKQKQQQPAEWSEEDEIMLQRVLHSLQSLIEEAAAPGYIECIKKEINWLESLRDNYKKCNSRWKPSEEQMLALGGVLDYLEESDNEDADIIRELINNLKKL